MAFQDREENKHPSFGMLSIHRYCGCSGYLFGSHAEPQNYIGIELHSASMQRELSNDWYHQEKLLMSIKMSPVQFSELLTTQRGTGVPVTIEFIDGHKVEQLTNVEDKRTATERQFKKRMKAFVTVIKERRNTAEFIIKKKTLSRDDQKELRSIIDSVVTEVTNNIPFFIDVFQEEMDKVVLDAKAEIDASITHAIVEAGIKALGIDFNNGQKVLDNKE